MKKKQNARERREAENRKKTEIRRDFSSLPSASPKAPGSISPREREKADEIFAQTPEEETRAFLDWLDQYDAPAKEEVPEPRKTGKSDAGGKAGRSNTMPRLNLEYGMPIVSEALDHLHMGLQELRHSGFRTVKLIHGYGSTGRGGKIRAGVLTELADMKRKKLIRDFIPGEAFGPLDTASRRLTEQDSSIPRDPDYGRMNHGITIVILR